MSSEKCQLLCLGLNVLNTIIWIASVIKTNEKWYIMAGYPTKLNPLRAKFLLTEHKHIFTFYVIPPYQ